jgi:glycosyltransferase involved in cell wall biosynthesis
MASERISVSAIIPTRNRPVILRRTLESLASQAAQPEEIILIDGSDDDSTYQLCGVQPVAGLGSEVRWVRASVLGAAAQRNQGVALATQSVIGFLDDDVLLEPECMVRIWRALQSDPELGGVSAMITNQRYQAPGRASRLVFRVLAGSSASTYAGRALGPAVTLLPEDRDDLPEVVTVEWLNLGCTLYRRDALPNPVFPTFFTGYSMGEDVMLSVNVGRSWRLANARTARIYHDSQPSEHKNDLVAFSSMELVNRHFLMTHTLGRRRLRDYGKLAIWELFQLTVRGIRQGVGRDFWRVLRGKVLGVREILAGDPAGRAT